MKTPAATHPKAPLVDRYELARFLNVKVRSIEEWSRLGLIPSYKIGNTVRYAIAEVLQAIRNRKYTDE